MTRQSDSPPFARARTKRGRTSTERGYGAVHQAKRRSLEGIVATGRCICARCGFPIGRGEPWDLGHVDGDRARWSGPEHRACNRATTTHRAEARRTSRAW